MGKRYRSKRRAFNMHLPWGGVILWADYRYPPKSHRPCADARIINFIESKNGFGKMFWEDKEPAEILIDPQAVPPDTELALLQKAAEKLTRMGMHVNPKLLKKPEEDEEPQLPSLTFVRSAKRSELEDVIKRFGWEVDADLNAKDLKAAVREIVEELTAEEE